MTGTSVTMLCTTCTIIFTNAYPTITQNHQPSLQTLEAASKFCAICTVLWSILNRHKWPLLPSPTVASLSLQPVSEYRIQRQSGSGSEQSLWLDFTVNANGVGRRGVQGELSLGSVGRFLLTKVGGMYISYVREKQNIRGY